VKRRGKHPEREKGSGSYTQISASFNTGREKGESSELIPHPEKIKCEKRRREKKKEKRGHLVQHKFRGKERGKKRGEKTNIGTWRTEKKKKKG